VLLQGSAGDYVVRPVGGHPYVVPAERFCEIYEPANVRRGHRKGVMESAGTNNDDGGTESPAVLFSRRVTEASVGPEVKAAKRNQVVPVGPK